MARQKLITAAIKKLLPPIGATSEKTAKDVKVPLKLFNPCGAGTWYITEYDPETKEAFGYVTDLGYDELGYIDLNELETVRLPFGLHIERDVLWDPNTTLADVIEKRTR